MQKKAISLEFLKEKFFGTQEENTEAGNQISLDLVVATILEAILNQAFRLDTVSLEQLSKLAGKTIHVELRDLELQWVMFPDSQGVTVLSHSSEPTHVQVVGSPFTLLRVLLQPEMSLANNPDITITGEATIAQQFLQIIHGLEIDWEEQLAQRIGDMPAHLLGTTVRRGQGHFYNVTNTIQLNISEYLQEEGRVLPAPAEMESFLDAVDILRDDVERLEQRIRRLQRHLSS